MPMLEQNGTTEIGSQLPERAAFEQQQRRRMLIALGVLLLALISVLIKDRQFWFPPSPSAESESPEQSVPQSKPLTAPAKPVKPVAPPRHAAPAAGHPRAKSKRLPAINPSSEMQSGPIITATNRAVLPPLEVEVVAGDIHRTIHPGTNAAKVEITHSAAAATQLNANIASATNASWRAAVQPVSRRWKRRNSASSSPI